MEQSGTLLTEYAEAWDHAEETERADIVRAVLEEVYLDLDRGEVRYVNRGRRFCRSGRCWPAGNR